MTREFQRDEFIPVERIKAETGDLFMDGPLRETFQSPFDDCGGFACSLAVGKKFTLLGRTITEPKLMGIEGDEIYIYNIRLEDGREMQAHPEEIFVQPEGCWNPQQ